MQSETYRYANADSARKAAKRVLGAESQRDVDFEVVGPDATGKFDYEAKSNAKKKGKTSSKKSAAIAPPRSELQQIELTPDSEPAKVETLKAPLVSDVVEAILEEVPCLPEAAVEKLVDSVVETVTQASRAMAFAVQQLSPDRGQVPQGVRGTRTEGSFGRRSSDTAREGGVTIPVTVGEAKKQKEEREIQNGVRKPSSGTVCRAVWDELDTMQDPDSKSVKQLAIDKGWNLNNASIEFYQWRKFHGIKGRPAKAPPAAQSRRMH